MISFQRVWLITILVSPTIYWTAYAIQESDEIEEFASFFPVLFLSVFLGFIFSIPTMLLFHLVYEKLFDKDIRQLNTKTILSLVLITGILGTFFIIGGSLFSLRGDSMLPACYLMTALCAIWFFSNNPKGEKLENSGETSSSSRSQ